MAHLHTIVWSRCEVTWIPFYFSFSIRPSYPNVSFNNTRVCQTLRPNATNTRETIDVLFYLLSIMIVRLSGYENFEAAVETRRKIDDDSCTLHDNDDDDNTKIELFTRLLSLYCNYCSLNRYTSIILYVCFVQIGCD